MISFWLGILLLFHYVLCFMCCAFMLFVYKCVGVGGGGNSCDDVVVVVDSSSKRTVEERSKEEKEK